MFTNRDLAVALLTGAAFVAATTIIGSFVGNTQYLATAVPILTALVIGGMLVYAYYGWRSPPVNPWAVQRDIMHRSNQRLPDRPLITGESVMYLALVMEEASETAVAMAGELRRATRYDPELDPLAQRWPLDTPGLAGVIRNLETAADYMHEASRSTRAHVSELPRYFSVEMTPSGARATLDGASDMAVVVCGYAEASGLPGMAGYVEAQRSNLSKANPITGMIDKDASGKWIKGPNYVPPDMGRVLAEANDRAVG